MSTSGGPTAVFKDLCLDSAHPSSAAAFWSRALGLSMQQRGDNYVLADGVDEHTVWVNSVPEEKSVKNRVHLDVHVASLQEIEALGAEPVADEGFWTVMVDPEGGEFCAFVRSVDQLPEYRLYELVVDCVDPERLAGWWADVFGIEAQPDTDSFCWFLEKAPGMPWDMVFLAVPEPKRGKNRIHWDVWGTTADLVAAGAAPLRLSDADIQWDVLADPEGNEFCVFNRSE